MSTNYTGTVTPLAQFPSPAPGPGVLPTVNEPVSGDPLNASTVAQMGKMPADFIAHIQGSVKLAPPRLPVSASSGFTAVTATGLGGTITPSGTVKIATGTNFFIQILVGGAVGVATFKTSVDGGTTFGGTQTTAASMTDATSGITLAFSGTFNSNGTAQFWSAYTPTSIWADGGGKNQSLVDHLGFRSGWVCERFEDWLGAGSLGSGSINGSPYTAYTNGTGTVAGGLAGGAFFQGRLLLIDPSTTSGKYEGASTAQHIIGPNASTTNYNYLMQWPAFLEAAGANNLLITMGLAVTFAPMSSANDGIWFKKASTDTNWQCVCVSGGVATTVDSGVIPTTATAQRFKIVVYAKNSSLGTQFGGPAAAFFINENLVAAITTNMTSQNLGQGFESNNTGGAASNQRLRLGPVRYGHTMFDGTQIM